MVGRIDRINKRGRIDRIGGRIDRVENYPASKLCWFKDH